jgi:hypothetical protein
MRNRHTCNSSSLPLRSVSRSSRTCWSATSRSPVNFIHCINVCETYDLQLGQHAACNIGRYRKILKDIFSSNLILNQIGKYRIIL